jgi:hypothetical protein
VELASVLLPQKGKAPRAVIDAFTFILAHEKKLVASASLEDLTANIERAVYRIALNRAKTLNDEGGRLFFGLPPEERAVSYLRHSQKRDYATIVSLTGLDFARVLSLVNSARMTLAPAMPDDHSERCPHSVKTLALLDGTLGNAENFITHMSQCSACRLECSRLEKSLQMVAEMIPSNLSTELCEGYGGETEKLTNQIYRLREDTFRARLGFARKKLELFEEDLIDVLFSWAMAKYYVLAVAFGFLLKKFI